MENNADEGASSPSSSSFSVMVDDVGVVVRQLLEDTSLEYPPSRNPINGYLLLIPRLVDHLPGRYLALLEWETPSFLRISTSQEGWEAKTWSTDQGSQSVEEESEDECPQMPSSSSSSWPRAKL